jgi:protein-tyrosine-phosphatase
MKTKVLFVCWGNTCRSVIAEHAARKQFGAVLETASAGVHPQAATDAKHAIEALLEFGIDASKHQPKDLRFLDPNTFHFVVTMDAEVFSAFQERFPRFPIERIEKWNVKNPWDKPSAYKACIEEVFGYLESITERLKPLRLS